MADKDEPLSCPEGGFTGFANESGSADGERAFLAHRREQVATSVRDRPALRLLKCGG